MLDNKYIHEQTCSIDGLIKENDFVQIVVDCYSWNCRVTNASCANQNTIEVYGPVLPALKGLLKKSTPVIILIASRGSLTIMSATVVFTDMDVAGTITLHIYKTDVGNRRIRPNAIPVLPTGRSIAW